MFKFLRFFDRKRDLLKKALTHYVSKDMAKRISHSEVDLARGPDLVEATIIYTNLDGFAKPSDEVADPRKVSEILNGYFTRIAEHVGENQGTVIQFIGDSVLAVWGAPFPEPQHRIKAALSAWLIQQASAEPVLGHKLLTRIGVHSGEVLAGNVGSADRFEYTVIGDAVNLATRLERLNKYFGTRILISEATAAGLEGRFITRPLGFFRGVAKAKAICVHELVAPSNSGSLAPWLEVFATGVREYCEGRFDDAARSMLQVCDMRDGNDGPSRFYLQKIEEALESEKPEVWDGAIDFTLE